MIAVNRRMASHDFLLLGLAVAVIVLTASPKPAKRQVVDIRHPDGVTQRYSLGADDPRLPVLQSKLKEWQRRPHNPALAQEKWHAELAEFYASRTQPEPGSNVVTVSFRQDQIIDDQRLTVQQQEHAHWLAVQNRATEAISKLQSLDEQTQQPPPIVFGEFASGPRSATDLTVAASIGSIFALFFAAWTYFQPPILLAGEADHAGGRFSAPANRAIKVSIPVRWIKVHQPAGVIARRVLYASVVAGALLCLIG